MNRFQLVSHALLGIAISVIIPTAALAATECKTQLETVLFSGKIDAKENDGKALKVIVGKRVARHGAGQLVAEISSGSSCMASCRVRSLESEANGAPVALFLDCQDKRFDRLAMPATIFWARHSGETASLRLGTWINGFKESPMSVQVDRYSEQAKRIELALAPTH